ncbi:unnamed protein product [Ilex paraguariensis]|uniref:Uncharacterized protein n=1 Tax=Ilex paraguariensis TaxID=185542 RepID=A0ABC8SAW0_9AQUA
MMVYSATSIILIHNKRCTIGCPQSRKGQVVTGINGEVNHNAIGKKVTCSATRLSRRPVTTGLITLAAAATATMVLSVVVGANAAELQRTQEQEEAGGTLSNIPQMLSSECVSGQQDCKKARRIQRPKSRQAESCTIKCVTTCIRGGLGSPGEGPLNVRRYYYY